LNPEDEALGRSRGGFSTKVHLACDGMGRPLSVVVTPGQRHGSTQLEGLLDAVQVARPEGSPKRRTVSSDTGESSPRSSTRRTPTPPVSTVRTDQARGDAGVVRGHGPTVRRPRCRRDRERHRTRATARRSGVADPAHRAPGRPTRSGSAGSNATATSDWMSPTAANATPNMAHHWQGNCLLTRGWLSGPH
jgi:hypothetical protein